MEALARKSRAVSHSASQWLYQDDTFSLDIGHKTPLGCLRRWARRRRLLHELVTEAEAGAATHAEGMSAIGHALRPRKRARDGDVEMGEAGAASEKAAEGDAAGKKAAGKDVAPKEPIVRDDLWRPKVGRLLDGPALFGSLHPDQGSTYESIKERLETRLRDLSREAEIAGEQLAAQRKAPSDNAPLLASVHDMLAAKRQKKTAQA